MADDLAVVPCAERSGSEHDSLSDCHRDEHEALVEDHEGDAGPEDAAEPVRSTVDESDKELLEKLREKPFMLIALGGQFDMLNRCEKCGRPVGITVRHPSGEEISYCITSEEIDPNTQLQGYGMVLCEFPVEE